MFMVATSQIRHHTPAVRSEVGQVAKVEHLDKGMTISLTKDGKVHVDRPGDRPTQDWSSAPPGGA